MALFQPLEQSRAAHGRMEDCRGRQRRAVGNVRSAPRPRRAEKCDRRASRQSAGDGCDLATPGCGFCSFARSCTAFVEGQTLTTLRWTALVLAALPAAAEYAHVRGARLYYEVHGATDAPPLVLLHGGMHSAAASFAKQIPEFARTRRVIAIEQMGHGHSPDVAGRALSYEGMTEDTAAVLRHIGIREADVVGWSNGGQIALRLAFTHPDLVRRVVASGVGFGASPAMRARLAAADVTAFFPAAQAEYAKVSPDGAAHWKVLGVKCRA
ncbi:MAG: alpha/beta hydrolase, partial [Acidobacteria bacterium]|nr:alpha/beta hydrolase [Acidobacteriota bacterium]